MKRNVTIQFNRNSDIPLYLQLFWHLKRLIQEGVFEGDEKLPSIRKMAKELGVNNITVVNAYKQLEKEGMAYSRVGSGTYVSFVSSQPENIDTGLDENNNLKMMKREQLPVKPEVINFSSSTPTPELFPVEQFKTLINRVLDRDRGNAFGYHEIQGYQPLRQSICRYLESYSIETYVDSIQVISGAQQGIDVVSKALIDFGDCIFVESPTYRGAIEAFRSRGARIVEIPIEEDGIDLEELERKLVIYKPRFIYVIPNFQNPTGWSYSDDKKRKLLELIKGYNTFIVEDDFLSELGFSGKKNLPLKSLDRDEKVIYIKSFSKIFMPGLRLGFMAVPGGLWNKILSAKHASDISTSGLLQRTFDLYLRENLWAKHIAYMREIYRNRYKVFIKAVKEKFPSNIYYKNPEGGLHLWFKLPEGYFAGELYNRCLKEDVLITPGALFYAMNSEDIYFRMSFAAVYPEQIEKGVSIVAGILKDYLSEKPFFPYRTEGYSPFL